MDKWVIDASMGVPADGLFCFCPIEFNADGSVKSIVTGLNVLTQKPPHDGEFIGVVHQDGQEAVEQFCEKYAVELATFNTGRKAG